MTFRASLIRKTLPLIVGVVAFASHGRSAEAQNFGPGVVGSLGLKFDEVSREFDIDIPNTSTEDTVILGVQTSPGLFVREFPKSIRAGKTARFKLHYHSMDAVASGGNMEVVRLLTPTRVQEYFILHGREEVVRLLPGTLEWTVGSKPEPKTTTLKITNASARLSKVTADAPDSADFQDLGGGVFQITVQPGKVDAARNAVVRLSFDGGVANPPMLFLRVSSSP